MGVKRGRPQTLELARLLKVGTTSRYNEEHCFQLIMANGQRFVLRAETRAERDKWLFAFHRSIAKIISMLLSNTTKIPRGPTSRDDDGPMALSLDRQTSAPLAGRNIRGGVAAGGALGTGGGRLLIDPSAVEARKDKERSLSGDSAVSPASTQRRKRGATTDSISGMPGIDATMEINSLSTMPRSIVRKVTRLDHERYGGGIGSDGSLAGSSSGGSGASGGSGGSGGNSGTISPLVRSPRTGRLRERLRFNSGTGGNSGIGNDRDERGRYSGSNDGWLMEGTPPTSPKSDAVSERSSMSECMFDLNLDDSMGGSGVIGDIGGMTPPQVQYGSLSGMNEGSMMGSGIGHGIGNGNGNGNGNDNGGVMGSAQMMAMMGGGVGTNGGSYGGSANTPDTQHTSSLESGRGQHRRTPSVIKWELSSGVSSIIGKRKTMEDVHVVIDCMGMDDQTNETKGDNSHAMPASSSPSTSFTRPRTAFYAVFDGHSGVDAAEYVSTRLLELLSNDASFWAEDGASIVSSLEHNFQVVDDEYLAKCDAHNQHLSDPYHSDWMCAGTTAVVCIVRSGHLWVATLGDSAAMLGRANDPHTGVTSSVMLSYAQTPGREDEVQRITAAGGWVKEDRELYLSRLHDMDLQDPFIKSYAEQKVGMVSIHRVNGEISVSRAFGDPDYKVGHGLGQYQWNFPKGHDRTFKGDLIIATYVSLPPSLFIFS